MQTVYLLCKQDAAAGPLKGVVIAVGKKLSKNQSEYNNIAASLGADYRWTYDSSCTHFIFQVRYIWLASFSGYSCFVLLLIV